MVFSSLEFLFLYFAVTIMVYFIVPLSLRNIVLLVVSLAFYGWGEPTYIVIMFVSIIVDYICGYYAGKYRETDKKRARRFVIASAVINLSILGFFKYYTFIVSNLQLLPFAFLKKIPLLADMELPIGISFYTFQTMSYTIDIYRGDAKVQKNIASFGAYVTLFPQLIAGPIVRYQDVDDQLRSRPHNIELFASGMRTFVCGMSKKILLANSAGAMWDSLRSAGEAEPTVIGAWLGLIFYMFQIYFDFSGYSDMAIGLGKMLGFRFKENFYYPYTSKSITDFWRRWHISMGTWFRDYVYIPLGGNRRGPWRQLLNLLIVWSLTGLWHGAEWTFVLWGLYYFLLLAGERFIWGKAVARLGPLRHLYALFSINVGCVLFRAESVSKAGGVLRAMLGGAPLSDGRTTYYLLEYGWVLALAVVAALPWKRWLEQWLQARQQRPLPRILLLWWPRLAALGLLVLSYMQLLTSTFNPFIYFRF